MPPSRALARARAVARAVSDHSDEDDISDSEDKVPLWKNYKPRKTYIFSGWNRNESGIQTISGPVVGNSHNSSGEEKLQIADFSPQAPLCQKKKKKRKKSPQAPDSGCSGYRLYCKRQGENRDFCVTARNGKLFLTLPNKRDIFQFWHKVEYNNTFMIVNDATNKAVKYTSGFGDQLCLVNKPMYPEKFLLWTESEDVLGTGHRYLCTQIQPPMVMDAWTGNIFDGTKISVFFKNPKVRGKPHENADNQLWKFIPC